MRQGDKEVSPNGVLKWPLERTPQLHGMSNEAAEEAKM
jgi:hypothetical protein